MDAMRSQDDALLRLKMKRPSERRSSSRTATRALDVLELFGRERRPLRAIEIATALKLGRSTVDQLLKTMVDSAHLVFDAAAKCYRPSHHFINFAGWITECYGADDYLHRLVVDLHARSGLSVTLTTPNDLFMQIIDMAIPVAQQTERGLKIAIFETAIGSAYLSTLSDADAQALARRAGLSEARIAEMQQLIAAWRAQGFADARSLDDFMWTIAVPLSATGVSFPLVIALSGPAADLLPYRATLAQMLRDAIAVHVP